MTQFNLLPDIKLEYLKAQRNRRLVIAVSGVVAGVSIIAAGLLFTLTAVQKSQINNLNNDIQKQDHSLVGQKNLNDILTIQNQIHTLSQLHQQEPNAADLVTYLNQTIPTSASLSTFTIDFNADTINMSGSADSLATVNQLVDSLEFATYSINGSGSNAAFSNVLLTSFGVQPNSTAASFSISLSFDPTLFNNTENIKLTVPSKVTTRSELGQPSVLFIQPKSTNTSGGN